MKVPRYSDSQIMANLEQAEAGTPAPKLGREHGMSSASFYMDGHIWWYGRVDDRPSQIA